MSVTGTLSELATEIANDLQQRALALEPEILRIQARLREIETIRDEARRESQMEVNHLQDGPARKFLVWLETASRKSGQERANGQASNRAS